MTENQMLDHRDGIIYALEARPPKLLALTPDGSQSITVISDMVGTPDGIVVDIARNTIYWTNMGSDFDAADGTIECTKLDGSARRILIGDGSVVTPKQIILDAEARHLYWCDREGMRVMRARTDGSGVTTLVQTGRYPDDASDVARQCVGIAIDQSNGHIYWTQKGRSDAGQGRIFRAGLDMPRGRTPTDRTDIELLMDNLPEPIDLEIDHRSGTLYWTDRGDLEDGNTLNRASIAPTGLSNHVIVTRGLEEGIGLALDLEKERAFVSDLSGKVRSVKFDGSECKTVFTCGPLTGIAFARSPSQP
jgi:hypothetical protein